VAPSFAELPWYADHPTRKDLRQEAYLLEVVIPFVEQKYPAQAKRSGRLLLGFSKSGWGAWSLLLRHPDEFERAAAWDAPLTMQQVGMYGNRPIFGTQENFEQYRLTDLLRERAEQLGTRPRLIHSGYGNFREPHRQAEALLKELSIPHKYIDGPQRKHTWHSGWVAPAVELLLSDE
jgi:enterochelin esterase-like enzyme